MILEKLKKGYLFIVEFLIIGDLFFNRLVILLVDYNKEGLIGFIINKLLKYIINDLIFEIDVNFKIYNGGFVEQDNLYFIYNIFELILNSVEIFNGIYWGGDFELIKDLINDGFIYKNNICFFLGYIGWDENQFENEMQGNLWIIIDNSYKNKIIGKFIIYFWKE